METPQNLVNYCYSTLREGIIRGDFVPGEKLKIAKLKTYLNSGPTPIREALSRLTATGLVVAEDNKGFRVKQVSEAEIRDLYATFNQIENLALCQAIDLGGDSWEANIVAALHKLALVENGQPPIEYNLWLQRNHEFHCALISGCNSPCLLKIREDLYQLFDRYCRLSFLLNQQFLTVNHKDHCEIAKAVIARNKEKACQLMTAHLKNSLELILKTMQTKG